MRRLSPQQLEPSHSCTSPRFLLHHPHQRDHLSQATRSFGRDGFSRSSAQVQPFSEQGSRPVLGDNGHFCTEIILRIWMLQN